MEKDKNKRYQTAQEMLDALEKLPVAHQEHKSALQFADPTSQLLRSQLQHAPANRQPKILTQEELKAQSQVDVAPVKSKFLSLVWVSLIGMSLVFMCLTWFLWGSGPESQIQVQDEPVQVTSQSLSPKLLKEKLATAQKAMSSQQFQEAFSGFQFLHENGDVTRPVLTGLALSAFHLKKYEAAAKAFENLIQTFPEEASRYEPFMKLAKQKAIGSTKQ